MATMATRKSGKTGSNAAASERVRKPPFDEDISFQRRQWQVERTGWVAMLLVIIAAVAGVFGGEGPIARATASDSTGSTEVRYARFARYAAPTALEVNVAASSSRTLRLSVSDSYLDAMKIRTITPPPTSTSIADRQHVLVFDRSASPGSTTIRIELQPTSMGRHPGWIAVDDAAPVSFAHFIYP